MAAQTVIGINFGGSASSVAVISKEGLADCIANDDGERQISNAISFSGDEEYIGIPAKSQLVRNAQNTILGFRNLVGKKYDAVSSIKPQYNSAPIVAGPNQEPAYRVTIKDQESTLTAQEVSTKYLQMLIAAASDFLGRKIDAAVLGVPHDFTQEQCAALEKACQDAAGVKVLQFLHEPAAAAVAYGLTVPASVADPTASEPTGKSTSTVSQDRNVVVLDVGATSTTVTVLAARSGLYVPLATVRDDKLGGESFDEALIGFFSKEFTKKTKVALDASNHRAMMKLRLACEVTKRTLSASNSATCSVESLADGVDFSGSINRSRFDLLSGKVYSGITDRVREACKQAGLDPIQIQEVILVGGTCKNPTLSDRVALLFPESSLVTSQIEPDQVIAKGCVLQAVALSKVGDEQQSYFNSKSSFAAQQSRVTTKPIGLLVPAPAQNGATEAAPGVKDGKIFVTVVEANTPLPARRIVDIPFAKDAQNVLLSLWEGKEDIHVQAPPPKAANNAEDSEDDEDEEEEEDVRTSIVTPVGQLAELSVAVKSQGQGKDTVRLTIIVTKDGKVEVEAVQNADGAKSQSIQL